MRVFAGPNGSGKSTIIDSVRRTKVKGKPIDFGVYINADELAKDLRKGTFSFTKYQVKTTAEEFESIALKSGLVSGEFTLAKFKKSYSFANQKIVLGSLTYNEQIAQIIADFLRKKLLADKKKISFETVFSHESKLDIMRQAREMGYKVYLYFIATESPEINKFRVETRVKKGGHAVPPDKIVSRYYRSLDLLYDAAQLTYQTYFFDNSDDTPNDSSFAHFKMVKGRKKWDEIREEEVPQWFIKYYSNKVTKGKK